MTRSSGKDLRDMINQAKKHVRAFQSLEFEPNELSEAILIQIMSEKIDYLIRNDFEVSLEPQQVPDWNKFITYLEKRCNILEAIDLGKKKGNDGNDKNQIVSKKPSTKVFNTTAHSTDTNKPTNKLKCYYCQKNHYMTRCEGFEKLNLSERWSKVRELELCPNCLNKGHSKDDCPRSKCPLCSEKHNKLLHETKASTSNQSEDEKKKSFVGISVVRKHILLGTAMIWVYDKFGKRQLARCLIDNGAMSNIISESLVQRLGLKREKINITVGVVNDHDMKIKFRTMGTIESRITSFKRNLEFLIVSRVCNELPIDPIDLNLVEIPDCISLADENFNSPGNIELLLGMEIYHELFDRKGDFLQLNGGLLVAENSQLGYVISGKLIERNSSKSFCGLISNEALHQDLKKFWEYDSPNPRKPLTVEEKAVESHFEKTHYRYKDGRYGVYMPLKPGIVDLGDSKDKALKQFASLERRLQRDPELKRLYDDFLFEYFKSNHMELCCEDVNEISSEGKFFLPHHPVLKEKNGKKKIRVVFNGSSTTSNGNSLNTCMYNGPVVQNSHIGIVLKFRFLRYVFSCDVFQLYLQVRVHESQRNLLLILYRTDPSKPIRVWKLCTVTWGTTAAEHSATRSLIQLSIDETEFPLASKAVQEDMYIDDCLSGADTLEEAIELKSQMIELLKRGKFELHKWCSNSPEILQDIPDSKREMTKDMIDGSPIKVLGITWDPTRDKFIFNVNKSLLNEKKVNRRSVLSDISTYYDPQGITEPVKFVGKLFMQKLWQKYHDWDEELDAEDSKYWINYKNELKDMKPIEIDRYILDDGELKGVQIHGFSDASMLGYGACIYVRTVSKNGKISVKLLCSKSRVAPLSSHTIPRLELLAANLLAVCMKSATESIPSFVSYREFLWTDSNIVLCWIRMTSRSLKTFVAHKVAEIQEMTNVNDWRYISTSENPADPLSRGVNPSEIHECEIWWQGAPFLMKHEDQWPIQEMANKPIEIHEVKIFTIVESAKCELIEKYSSLRKLIKTTALIFRFYDNMRNKKERLPVHHGEITISELNRANNRLIKLVQHEVYAKDIECLEKNHEISKKSPLLTLSPFLDKDKILRLGGRLSKAPLSMNQKHPIILPPDHPYTNLLIRCYHQENLHAGTQFTLNFLRMKYWITQGRRAVKKIVKSCVRCFKMKPSLTSQFMGDLPEMRLKPTFPFQVSTVDYCGHFWLKANPRGTIKTKGFVSVFQCATTRAIHLELAGDLSSDSFINCLYRFVGRRGAISDLYSDNGTNFKGAERKLNELYEMFQDQEESDKVRNWCERKQIQWHFIPPQCPHMGGTWEASVKLTKTLLVKYLTDAYLSYEEFNTVLCRIESVLNSRPITKLSDDETDLNALTPGHLIIGRPLNELVEPDITHLQMNRLSRFQYLTRLKQDFWKQWTHDYLHQLQMRYKWHDKIQVKVGQMVIIKDDNLPSFEWLLGRIIELHPGSDSIVRVVTVRTKNGNTKRHLAKLCYLPIEDNE